MRRKERLLALGRTRDVWSTRLWLRAMKGTNLRNGEEGSLQEEAQHLLCMLLTVMGPL
jgi:hypothetical protein